MPGPPPPPDPNQLPPGEAGEHAETILNLGLQSDDQLFHVALYEWMVENNQFDRLLRIKSSFLEVRNWTEIFHENRSIL